MPNNARVSQIEFHQPGLHIAASRVVGEHSQQVAALPGANAGACGDYLASV